MESSSLSVELSAHPAIALVGAGTMGTGIAHVFARAGFPVLLYNVDAACLDRGMATAGSNLGLEVAKGKLTQTQADEDLGRLKAVMHFGGSCFCGDCRCPKNRPCPLLIRMLDTGWRGRKSGGGFYTYQQENERGSAG